MTWTAISWAFEEKPTSAKRNLEAGNTTHVREEAAYKLIVSLPYFETDHSVASTASYDFHVDGVKIGSTVAGTSEVVLADIDLDAAGIASGIRDLSIVSSTNGAFTSRIPEFKFVKTPDMVYMTIWVKFLNPDTSGSPNIHKVERLNVVGHLVAQSWT